MNVFRAVLRRSPRRLLVVGLLGGLFVAALWLRPHVSAWQHLRHARSALKCYHSREGIEHLRLCLRTWPDDAEVLFLAARMARRAGKYAEAEVALNKYEAKRGCDDTAALERILLRAENGDLDRSSGLCKHWIASGHPDAPFIFEALVRGYLHVYRLPEAHRWLQRWRQTQPDNPQTYFVEGEIHDCEVLASEAVAAYERVLALDPEHEEARLKLTAALLDQRAYAEALPHLEYLRQRQPDNLQVSVRSAACWTFLGKQEEAVRLLDDVLAQQPDFAPALAERGKIALAREEYSDAENWLRQAVACNPSDRPTRYSLVQCLRRMGKESDAQQQDQQLHRLDSDLKRINQIAIHDMHQAPHNAELHCELGVIFLRNGFVEQGLHWLNSAIRLDAHCVAAQRALADYYQENKITSRKP